MTIKPQFHQISIVKRYLTQSPELEASIELLTIVKQLCHTDKESFVDMFEQWADFLKERRIEPKTGKTRYVHKRLRIAYLSMKRNMPYLWTWYDNMLGNFIVMKIHLNRYYDFMKMIH